MRFSEVIENYINGNLTDFYHQYKNLKRTVSFWVFVTDNYGHDVALKAQEYLIKKGF